MSTLRSQIICIDFSNVLLTLGYLELTGIMVLLKHQLALFTHSHVLLCIAVDIASKAMLEMMVIRNV